MNRSSASGLKTTVVLRSIPRTALISDVRRLLDKHRVENVQNVHIDYHRFISVGKAYITFTHPAHVNPAFSQLRTAQISGLPLDVVLARPLQNILGRSRGVKGREEAVHRGILDGNGPDAGVRERGKNVVVWGLPGKFTPQNLRDYLQGFRLAGTAGCEDDIIKIEPEGRPSFTSRHYVRTISVSEAHRLVRRLHMTQFTRGGPEYTIRAQIVY